MGLKVIALGLNAIEGKGAIPVQERGMVCGLPGALSLICREADSTPAEDGLNVTEKEQLPFGASVTRQVVDCEKSDMFVPVIFVAPRLIVSV